MRILGLSILVCLILAAIVLMVLSSLPADGQGLDDAMTIQSDRDSIHLEPGEDGWIILNASNTANVSLWVQLRFTFLKVPNHSTGTIIPEVFQLAPGESRNVSVEVISHARLWQDPHNSDFKVKAFWGFNATIDHDQRWSTEKEFDVVDDFSHQEDRLYLIIVILAVIMTCILILIWRHRRFTYRPAS